MVEKEADGGDGAYMFDRVVIDDEGFINDDGRGDVDVVVVELIRWVGVDGVIDSTVGLDMVSTMDDEGMIIDTGDGVDESELSV